MTGEGFWDHPSDTSLWEVIYYPGRVPLFQPFDRAGAQKRLIDEELLRPLPICASRAQIMRWESAFRNYEAARRELADTPLAMPTISWETP